MQRASSGLTVAFAAQQHDTLSRHQHVLQVPNGSCCNVEKLVWPIRSERTVSVRTEDTISARGKPRCFAQTCEHVAVCKRECPVRLRSAQCNGAVFGLLTAIVHD
jgi:hypothetical protein